MHFLSDSTVLILATLAAFFLALLLHWATLSLLFLLLPGKGRATRFPRRALGLFLVLHRARFAYRLLRSSASHPQIHR
jgi:hypothetical protein